MHALTIPNFAELATATARSPGELERELRVALASKLYELGRVSLGQAAGIVGVSRIAMIDELAQVGVALIAGADLAAELAEFDAS